MSPDEIDTYELGNIEITVHYFEDLPPRYWIQAGGAAIMMPEEEFENLLELTHAFREEGIYTHQKATPWLRVAAAILFAILMIFIIYAL